MSALRKERAFDISAVYTFAPADRLNVRVFGGPTYFHVTNDMVDGIGYLQNASGLFRLNVVNISSFTRQQVSASALGFNVGADVSTFFTRRLGVGGIVRFNRGTITVVDPLSGNNGDLQVGHLEIGGGLRLRF